MDDPSFCLEAVLTRWACVRAAWLFGSVADGRAGPLSDVDVAVLGCADLDLDGLARLGAELTRAVGRQVDLVVVERASPVLAFEISSRGKRLHCRDQDAADAWEDRALRHYLGTHELRRIVQGYVSADLLERR